MTKILKVWVLVFLLGLIIIGYGGLCRESDEKSSTGSSTSLPTNAELVSSTLKDFGQMISTGNTQGAMDKIDAIDDAEKRVNESFYADPANKPMVDDFLAALNTAVIKEESENYMILELTSPTIGKFDIWMLKRDGEWKIAY